MPAKLSGRSHPPRPFQPPLARAAVFALDLTRNILYSGIVPGAHPGMRNCGPRAGALYTRPTATLIGRVVRNPPNRPMLQPKRPSRALPASRRSSALVPLRDKSKSGALSSRMNKEGQIAGFGAAKKVHLSPGRWGCCVRSARSLPARTSVRSSCGAEPKLRPSLTEGDAEIPAAHRQHPNQELPGERVLSFETLGFLVFPDPQIIFARTEDFSCNV